MIQQPPVLTTSPAGTTFATTNTTGKTVNVSVSANGATMANYWLNAVSQATSAAQFMMTVPPAPRSPCSTPSPRPSGTGRCSPRRCR